MRRVDADFRAKLHGAALVFFDCDGVIFDSNGFKQAAMARVIGHYPAPLREAMTAFWRSHGGVSRRVKFGHFFRELVKDPDWEDLTEAAVQRFGEYSLDAFRHVEPLAGALTLMRSVGRERLVVVSGADQKELYQVFRDKQLEPLVSEVLGAPTDKQHLVESVLAARGVHVDEALLIGDGARDFEVCQTLGMHFVYLHEHSEWDGAFEALAQAPNASWAKTWDDLLEAAGLAGSIDAG
ncbi:MAG TPA: HAD hydrolase-like protein [Polyangiaceae bacterium]|nr:HAD hydrolase-like protein [Polyangiaceae bacterium]